MSDQEDEMDTTVSVITPTATTSSGTKKKGKDGKDKASIKGSGADQIQLPIARVKKIIKADKDVKYLSSDASILLAKATELFLDYLVSQAKDRVVRDKRRILTYNDVATCVHDQDLLEFLTDVIPKQKQKRDL